MAKVSHAILHDKTPQPLWPGHNVQEIRKIIMKCLEKDPHNRYGSAAELLADLRALT